MRAILVLLAAAVTVLAIALILRPPPLEAPQATAAFLARMDADGSGSVSEAEHQRMSDNIVSFTIFDTDGSGELETWEVEQMLLRVSPDTPQPALLPRVR
ncbi:MAG: hypothetical protein ACI8RZ_003531 [Myxococcota bacterium]|jgi:hypothetical protein